MTAVVDAAGEWCGMFTDGDLRRAMERNARLADEPGASIR